MKKEKSKNDEKEEPIGEKKRWVPNWMSIPLILVLGFFIVMLFVGDNSYLKNREYRSRINELNAEIKTNKDTTAYYEKRLQELNTDPETLEKIAREQYGMKKSNEDVYVTDIP